MTLALSHIEAEARRLGGRRAERARPAVQQPLIELCRSHWAELRGPEPGAALARALWSVTPPLADLFVDLHAAGDPRLAAMVGGLGPARALALLVLAEIERGDAEGASIAYDAMMLLESPAAGREHAGRVAAALRGELDGPRLHPHSSQPALWKASAIIAAHARRDDLAAVATVIAALAAAPGAPPDESLERLREGLRAAGVQFLGIDDDGVRLELHGRERSRVTRNRLADTLAEIRRLRLG